MFVSWNSHHFVSVLEIGVIIILFSWLASIPIRSQSFDYSVVTFLSSFPLTNIADKLKQLQLIYTQNNHCSFDCKMARAAVITSYDSAKLLT